jgi:uncharacterized protein (DUF305 family)
MHPQIFRSLRRHAIVAISLASISVAAPLQAQGPPAHRDFTDADVTFMQGMIGHHAQALEMAVMATTHGASPRVALFCKKVLISQRDEINQMKSWLNSRGQSIPDTAMAMEMPGMTMAGTPMMPGMLTPAQLKQLDAARGTAWDSLFLVDMIQHHRGALVMVAKLFASPGAGQEAEIFGYASGVDADQRAEIDRMQQMLTTSQGSSSQ